MKKITLLIFILFKSFQGNSQIIFTDVNPDVVTIMSTNPGFADNIYAIDFNNDGTEEFNFRWDDNSAADWYMHLTFSPTSVIGLKNTATNQYGGRFIKPSLFNDVIDANMLWGTSIPEPFIGESTVDNNFLNLGDRYIPVRINISGNLHYGWILVNFINEGSTRKLTIKSYAYNTIANQQILAGQTSVLSVGEINEINKISLYPNPTNNFIKIQNNENLTENLTENFNYTILDLTGKIIKNGNSKFNEQINIESLGSGNYIIQIKTKNGEKLTEKFIKN